MAKQAAGAVVVRQGDTMVLCTATVGNLRDVDFLPLTVDVEERMYAAGKIPGSFFKREGRAGEKGTLTARMIDRPIRPLFPKGWHYETQLVAIPLSVDHVHPYDILAMNGASAALMISPIPLPTPGRRGAHRQDRRQLRRQPDRGADLARSETTDLDLIVAGTDEAILMVEAGANEIPEAEILDALDIAHDEIKKLCAAAARAGREGRQGEARRRGRRSSTRSLIAPDQGLARRRPRRGDPGRGQARAPGRDRRPSRRRSSSSTPAIPTPTTTPSKRAAARSWRSPSSRRRSIRERIAVDKKRPDGRAAERRSARSRSRSASLRARTARRSSRAARRRRSRVAALGTLKEEMRLDTLGLEKNQLYWHHYNFPPFSVGEAGFMRGPKRRDIGHGALAERALVPVVPTTEEFPYTIRVVSDILESNGSSSMASVCGSSLSLMDAGVPIKAPVAGIAMGLIKEGDDYIVLTDIAGVEDHLGDMDFKVAGTEEGITALQMDIKITGVTFDILRDALAQAKEARLDILGKMARGHRRAARGAVAVRAAHHPDPDRPGEDRPADRQGRRDDPRPARTSSSRRSTSTTRARSSIYSSNGELGEALAERIRTMTKEVEVGDEFTGKVVKTTTFGAFVELAKGTDGLLHISNVSPGKRVETVEDVLNKGDEIEVRWSRSTASAAASACASPTTRRSPASPTRSSPPSSPPAATAAAATAAPRRDRDGERDGGEPRRAAARAVRAIVAATAIRTAADQTPAT